MYSTVLQSKVSSYGTVTTRSLSFALELSLPLAAFTPGTSMELMMPHEDERNVPEENTGLSFKKEDNYAKTISQAAVKKNSETLVFF